jgi:hypothetical protein
MDTAGRIERFNRKYGKSQAPRPDAPAAPAAEAAAKK